MYGNRSPPWHAEDFLAPDRGRTNKGGEKKYMGGGSKKGGAGAESQGEECTSLSYGKRRRPKTHEPSPTRSSREYGFKQKKGTESVRKEGAERSGDKQGKKRKEQTEREKNRCLMAIRPGKSKTQGSTVTGNAKGEETGLRQKKAKRGRETFHGQRSHV